MKRALEAALLLLVLVGLGIRLVRHFAAPPKPEAQPGVLAGEHIETPPELDPGQRDRTVLLALSPRCPFCIESMPFYRRLSHLPAELRDRFQIVGLVLHGEDLEVEARALGQQGVQLDQLLHWDYRRARVFGTPTLVLVRPDRQVERVWRGMLNPEQENEVLEALRSAASRAPAPAEAR